MKKHIYILAFIILNTFLISCKKEIKLDSSLTPIAKNQIKYAKNFELYEYPDFKILKITKPWQNASSAITYVLAKQPDLVPDSLKNKTFIQIPVQKVIATSTTYLPSLEMLNESNSLIGFPNLNYISSPEIRENIKQNKVTEVGQNEGLNTEVIIDINPNLIIGYGMENTNKALENLKQMGISVIYNADWTEQTPLGKAEWIKFFGALYNKSELANTKFSEIENQYNQLKALAKTASNKPKVFSGGLYQNVWNAPKADSWGAIFLEDANADYIWKNHKGDGSIAISMEQALNDAQNIPVWIAPASCESFEDLKNNSKHNMQFDAIKTGEIYSFAMKKGETGGTIYYELAPNRPDLVLKDLIKILHPELLPNYNLYFYEKLK